MYFEEPATDALPPIDQPPPIPPTPTPQPAGRLRIVAASVLAGLLVGGGSVALALHHRSSSTPTAAAKTAATIPTTPAVPSPGGTPDVRAIVAKASPAVVSITDTISDGQFGSGRAAGTGMILTPDGQVLTNNHVVGGSTNIRVNVPNLGTRNAHVLGTDPTDDVALIQIEGVSNLPTLALGNSSTLQVGDPVVTVGNALALNGGATVTTGIVSALNRQIDTDTGSLAHLIQTDAPINPGNSGGPLLDGAAQVIGMNTAVAGGAQNIGFSIAIDNIKPLLADLEKGTTPAASSSGVAYLGVTLDDSSQGAVVTSVSSGSPAAQAGIVTGDVITDIDNQSVAGASDLVSAIRAHQPGDKVKFTLLRNGASRTVTVTLATRPAQTSP
jgi:S1-C subfamily serine protease